MKKKYLFRFVCLLLSILSIFTACDKSQGRQEDTTEELTADESILPDVFPYALSDFQIVRPERSSSDVKDAAMRLNETIKEKFGKPLRIKTDFDSDDEKTCEILVGETTRGATQEVLATLTKGDYIIQSVKVDDGVKIVLLGATDLLVDKAVAEFETLITDNLAEEDGQIKSFSLKTNLYELYANYTLNISDPILIAKGESFAEIGMGPYQFPKLHYTTSGAIRADWGMHYDKIYDNEVMNGQSSAVSDDGGLTWRETTDKDEISYTRSYMKNGKYFVGFTSTEAHAVDYLNQYTPLFTARDPSYSSIEIYSAADLKELQDVMYGQEYNPNTGKIEKFQCKINWPYAAVAVYDGNIVFPISRAFSVHNEVGDLATEDALYFCTYTRGVDLKTGAVTKYSRYYSVYVFKSTDNARTWDCISQIPVTSDIVSEATASGTGSFDGFCEPQMEQMPDGSLVMLMRTGHNNPSYLVRSTDGGLTWSEPVKFDDLGVLPQILTTACGVTLASYGRPELFIRSTNDPAGLTWDDPIEIPLSSFGTGTKSCFYTYFLELDDHTVMMIYTDFYYSETGKVTNAGKSILARIITIEPVTTS